LIRVGFVSVFAVREWLGGLNYLRNLLQAVTGLDGRRIEPVLFTRTDAGIADQLSHECICCIIHCIMPMYRF